MAEFSFGDLTSADLPGGNLRNCMVTVILYLDAAACQRRLAENMAIEGEVLTSDLALLTNKKTYKAGLSMIELQNPNVEFCRGCSAILHFQSASNYQPVVSSSLLIAVMI